LHYQLIREQPLAGIGEATMAAACKYRETISRTATAVWSAPVLYRNQRRLRRVEPKAYATNGASEATRAQRANASVLKTEGTGWDVGHAVKFLLSDYARYITGQVRVVNGGVTLQGPGRDFVSLSPNSGSG
jgi:NAD(P)-dependent dehydrogenase (short-subunit alcohol dehydrogenase family)